MAPTRASASRRSCGTGNAEERHRAAIGPGQTEQGADQGCLPRTVRSEVAESGAPRHEKLHLIDGDGRAEALGQAVRLDRPSVALIVNEGDVTSRRGSRCGAFGSGRAPRCDLGCGSARARACAGTKHRHVGFLSRHSVRPIGACSPDRHPGGAWPAAVAERRTRLRPRGRMRIRRSGCPCEDGPGSCGRGLPRIAGIRQAWSHRAGRRDAPVVRRRDEFVSTPSSAGMTRAAGQRRQVGVTSPDS